MPATRTLTAEIAASHDWWREAGVDFVFSEEPHGWLAPPGEENSAAGMEDRKGDRRDDRRDDRPAERRPQRQPAPATTPGREAPPQIGGDPALWPIDLAAFTPWWLTEPSLDAGTVRGRVPPRAAASPSPDLLVLVPMPEPDDAETLLSGPQGRLLNAMLAAMGIAPEQTYIASVLPRHLPVADWPSLAAAGIGNVLAHHLALVAPRRIVSFGRNILPLLDHDPAQKAAVLRNLNQEPASVPHLAGHELGLLAGRPGAKAAFWRNWLDWDQRGLNGGL